MLTGGREVDTAESAPATPSSGPDAVAENSSKGSRADATRTRLERVLRIEWLGQTVASICWIASVLAYEINSTGDWLQLCAASSWLLANIAAALSVKAD